MRARGHHPPFGLAPGSGAPTPIVVGPRDGPARWIEREAASGDLLILAGTAGGLRTPSAAGAAFAVTRVFDEDGRLRATCSHPLPPMLTVSPGSLVCVDAPAATLDAKRSLASKNPAATLVDMESLPFVEAAERKGLPWVIVRGVSDGPDDELPVEAMQWITATGAMSWSALLASIARRPSLMTALPALARHSRRALRSIADLVNAVLNGVEATTAGGDRNGTLDRA
ncbi:MAG TPA: hypothetical protein PKC43_14040 [Phycisphaerales bacterium]|nr:hypothetical protein [Phycisphaerales bacterium]HMP38555.1 hypothetical protein [Phycisphaerales bacterium]